MSSTLVGMQNHSDMQHHLKKSNSYQVFFPLIKCSSSSCEPSHPPSSDFLSRVSSAMATFSMISCNFCSCELLLFSWKKPGPSCCKRGILGVPIKFLLTVISLKFWKDLQPPSESMKKSTLSTEGSSAKGKSFFRNSRLGLPNKSKYWVRSL